MNTLKTSLTLDALHVLEAIARRGSFAAAAKELGRVPSAITYAVRKLEDDLDVLLFDRRGYRARLTPAGEELLRDGRHLLAATDDLARRVKRVAQGWETELRIALDTLVPFERVLPLLDAFCTLAPTQVRFTHEVLGGTWDALVSGRVDLAIGAAQQGPQSTPLSSGYRSFELERVLFVFAVSATHPLADMPAPLPLEELRRHRQVVAGDTSQQLVPRTAGLLGTSHVLTVPSMRDKLAAQIAGIGVGFVPEPMARDAIARGALIVKSTEHSRDEGEVVTLSVAWRATSAATAGARSGKALAWWLDVLKRGLPPAAASI